MSNEKKPKKEIIPIDQKYDIAIFNNGEVVKLLRAGIEWCEPDAPKAWIAVASRLQERDQAIELLREARDGLKNAESAMFYACQPNRGDLFDEFDDKNRPLLTKIKASKLLGDGK